MIPKAEHPRPDRMRANWLNLNGEWAFALFPKGEEVAETAFAKARTAYDQTITVPFTWTCPLSGVAKDTAGIGWYRRSVTFEAQGRVFLCFGAVDYLAEVYVNGQLVGKHQGGYTPFEFDVTDVWQKGENRIEVRAEDMREKYQTYGKQGYGEIQGIWQTVWLEARPEAHLQHFRFTTRCSGEVSLEATAFTPAAQSLTLTAAFDGQRYAQSFDVKPGSQTLRMDFTLAQPKLWSPESPYLYEGTLSLGEDVIETYFGVREVGTAFVGGREYPWITLNGKPVYLSGTLDQAFHPKGFFTYPTDEDMKNEAWRLKRLGLNMVRIHIKPEEPRKLYWMDKLGVLVMADMPCFWGAPDVTARAAYESEWPEAMMRDVNHPSIFSWVMFNESWGLLTGTGDERRYLPDTQVWVRDVYRRAKQADPTRLVEDNSPCRYDHVETDINTWHFYINGYEQVRDHIRNVVKETYPGSAFNCIGEHRQGRAPLMNSECGLVWGVDGSAGDSDLAWQYRYMLNEYRLHEKLCGFVFTEFHDVVNEFNGYYRIDDTDKDWGYQDFCRGMTLRDLHAEDFVAVDAPPCQTVQAGAAVAVPLVLSSFGDANHGKALTVAWELWHDGPDGRVLDDRGTLPVQSFGYGATPLCGLAVRMPRENAAAVLSLYLTDEDGTVISRNFVTFDVRAGLSEGCVEIPVTSAKTEGFELTWTALAEEKLCCGGAGAVTYDIDLATLPKDLNGLTLFLELGAKRVLNKDRERQGAAKVDLDFMHGYRVDRGQFPNSYWMTDEDPLKAMVEVAVDGQKITRWLLPNDPSDCRGVLSWHAQPHHRKLEEAGSYGYLQRLEVPSRLIPAMLARGKMTLTLRTDEGGLAVYGRNAGRYALGVLVRAW